MGFAFDTPPIAGGTVLIIERLESQNYAAAVAGWAIFADGDAEFRNLTARGTFISGDGTGAHIEISSALASQIAFYTGAVTESLPGAIIVGYDAGQNDGVLTLVSPLIGSGDTASIRLIGGENQGESTIELDATTVTVTRVERISATALNAWTASGGLWYYKSLDGMVHIGGRVTGGVINTACINLPAGFRPVEQMQFACNANGAYGSIRIDTNGNVVPTAGSTTQVSLSGINFPSFA